MRIVLRIVRAVPPHKLLLLWLCVFAFLMGLTLNNVFPMKGDERYYTISAMNMVKTGDWMIPDYYGVQRFQKPILTYWVVSLAYTVFGIGLWSARVPALLVACSTLLLVYRFSRSILDDSRFALFNVLLLSSSFLFVGFSRIAMTDPFMTFFSTLALFFFYRSAQEPGRIRLYYAGAYAALGLAWMAKGFIGLLPLFAWVLYLLAFRPAGFRGYLLNLVHPLNILILSAIAAPWHLYVYRAYPEAVMSQASREAGHVSGLISPARSLGFAFFYGCVLTASLLPFSLSALRAGIRRRIGGPGSLWLVAIYVATVLAIFIFAVTARKERYLLPAVPAFTLLVGYILYSHQPRRRTLWAGIAAALFLVQGFVFAMYPLISREALRELVGHWRTACPGTTLGVFRLDSTRDGWVRLFSGGEALVKHEDADYVVAKGAYADSLTTRGYSIAKRADKREKIEFRGGRPVVVSESYYLLRRDR